MQANLKVPRLVMTSPPSGDTRVVAEAARMLVAAEPPLIIEQRAARTPNGRKLLQELAETLQAPVNRQERMNLPNRHPLSGNGGPGYQADVTVSYGWRWRMQPPRRGLPAPVALRRSPT